MIRTLTESGELRRLHQGRQLAAKQSIWRRAGLFILNAVLLLFGIALFTFILACLLF